MCVCIRHILIHNNTNTYTKLFLIWTRCFRFLYFSSCAPKGGQDVFPPVWNLSAVIWFHFPICSLVILPPLFPPFSAFDCLLPTFQKFFKFKIVSWSSIKKLFFYFLRLLRNYVDVHTLFTHAVENIFNVCIWCLFACVYDCGNQSHSLTSHIFYQWSCERKKVLWMILLCDCHLKLLKPSIPRGVGPVNRATGLFLGVLTPLSSASNPWQRQNHLATAPSWTVQYCNLLCSEESFRPQEFWLICIWIHSVPFFAAKMHGDVYLIIDGGKKRLPAPQDLFIDPLTCLSGRQQWITSSVDLDDGRTIEWTCVWGSIEWIFCVCLRCKLIQFCRSRCKNILMSSVGNVPRQSGSFFLFQYYSRTNQNGPSLKA